MRYGNVVPVSSSILQRKGRYNQWQDKVTKKWKRLLFSLTSEQLCYRGEGVSFIIHLRCPRLFFDAQTLKD